MNTRQGILVTLTTGSLFINFAALYWTMWSVLTASLAIITITDFMFFEVRLRAISLTLFLPRLAHCPASVAQLSLILSLSCSRAPQDNEFWP